jgi:hypothetical protein
MLTNSGVIPLKTIRVHKSRRYPEGIVMTVYDLPKSGNVGRWTPSRKEVFIIAVREGLITREKFLRTYDVEGNDFDSWVQRYGEYGLVGLRSRNSNIRYMSPQPKTTKEDSTREFVHVLNVGIISYDPALKVVTVEGKKVRLSGRQREILSFLMQRPGKVATREELLEFLYGEHSSVSSTIIDMFVFQLRRNLHKYLTQRPIETIYGRGYRLKKNLR